ncbi:MAG: amino acid ABC transporter permease, partial [Chloroflexota bacterium]|nr:amino acid ABC transporter permease [Chloroflexota bacterium]
MTTPRTEALAPPTTALGPATWLRQNLFSTWYNSLVTVALGAALVVVAILVVQWAAEARWGVVTSNLRLFLIGRYPFDEAWRIWLSLALLSLLAGISAGVYRGAAVRTLTSWLAAGQALIGLLALLSGMGPLVAIALGTNAALVWIAFVLGLRAPISSRPLALLWLAFVPVVALILQGFAGTPLPVVETRLWGGLLLTFVLAIAGIVLSFPIGVLLALGRRSTMPAVRVMSTVYIEIIRGVPLVTILFMAAILLPLLLPGGLRIEAILRAIGGITLFSAAYVAENVRGGLQAIPTGQYEAAHAIGLNAIQTNLHIVLPQALRSVIPANVGLFISLLKDTTLVSIAGGGLLELLGIGQAVLANPQWIGTRVEVFIFISAIFFVLCYT